jgi:hypothetical protein
MAGETESREATRALGALPFGNIIGGPLVAAVNAQAQAARSTVEFIESVGFMTVRTPILDSDGSPVLDDDSNPTVTEGTAVRTVTFKYKSGEQQVDLVVPILTIVPIPFIRIDDMTIQFKANISAEATKSNNTALTTETNADASASASYTGGFWEAKADFNASYSSKKDSTSSANSKYAVEYTMDVYVHAVQDDIPAGLNKVLNMLTESIHNAPASLPAPDDE